jgi:hypothetical protein
MVSAPTVSTFVKIAILFLLACLLVLFTAAAMVNRPVTTDDDDDAGLRIIATNLSV